MDEAKRERVIAAAHTWRAARQAYLDEADNYVGRATLDDGRALLGEENPYVVEPLTTESWQRLNRLRDAERDALQAFKDALHS